MKHQQKDHRKTNKFNPNQTEQNIIHEERIIGVCDDIMFIPMCRQQMNTTTLTTMNRIKGKVGNNKKEKKEDKR